MRSPKELLFRLKQEAANLSLYARGVPLAGPQPQRQFLSLPDPGAAIARSRGTGYASEIEKTADLIMEHRFPLLGFMMDTGPVIHWRRDYLNGKETGLEYFRRIPYLDPARAGDHKNIWELNRHQHLVFLAQAFLLTGRRKYLDEVVSQLESWWTDNPFLAGINWTSALEVSFRVLSWIWVYHLAGRFMNDPFRRLFLAELYKHGLYIENNLSIYFSPNTHLLGEAVALHALGVLFPEWAAAERWRRAGGDLVVEQMKFQVRDDGSHFEQSSYYHLYAVDLFLFHSILGEPPAWYLARLERMAEYLEALAGPSRELPFLGDDDGGRLFHPYGLRDRFVRATLSTCGVLFKRQEWIRQEDLFEQALWWTPHALPDAADGATRPAASRLFADAGVAVMRSGDVHAIVDAGGFGFGAAGHSHSDTLSIILRDGSDEILTDSGTFTYVGDPHWRDWFRGSAAHNTIRVAGTDQARPAGPFAWESKPHVNLVAWKTCENYDFLDASCSYGQVDHRRRVFLIKIPAPLLIVFDEVQAPVGEQLFEQFWHLGGHPEAISSTRFRSGGRAQLIVAEQNGAAAVLTEGGANGWRSRAPGHKEPAPVVYLAIRRPPPVRFAAAVTFLDLDTAITFGPGENEITLHRGDTPFLVVNFNEPGYKFI